MNVVRRRGTKIFKKRAGEELKNSFGKHGNPWKTICFVSSI